jgi:HAE1 family hydrophobic/amphiphilic exporter-1
VTNRSIGIVVMGGQTLCLLITLLLTPVAYSLFEDLRTWRPGRRVRVRKAAAEAVPVAALRQA